MKCLLILISVLILLALSAADDPSEESASAIITTASSKETETGRRPSANGDLSSEQQIGGKKRINFLSQLIKFKKEKNKKKKKKKKYPLVTFSTRTETSTETSTITSSTVGLCAQLVNVTGACRRRRGVWVEDPIILSFDDDMDEIDGPLSASTTLR